MTDQEQQEQDWEARKEEKRRLERKREDAAIEMFQDAQQGIAKIEQLRAALLLAVFAMRAPFDDWKGILERKALDAARAVLDEDQNTGTVP